MFLNWPMELELHDGLYHTHDLGEFYLPDVNPGGASSIVPPLLVYLKNYCLSFGSTGK